MNIAPTLEPLEDRLLPAPALLPMPSFDQICLGQYAQIYPGVIDNYHSPRFSNEGVFLDSLKDSHLGTFDILRNGILGVSSVQPHQYIIVTQGSTLVPGDWLQVVLIWKPTHPGIEHGRTTFVFVPEFGSHKPFVQIVNWTVVVDPLPVPPPARLSLVNFF
jgi:hypothetical protein